MQILRTLLVSSICVFLSGLPAQAQPVVAPFSGSAQVYVLADDGGPVSTLEVDQLSSNIMGSDSGHLSDPFGSASTFAYQLADGTSASTTSVVGPLAPFIEASSSASGTQAGVIPSTTVVAADGSGSQNWQFAFYAPTFSAQAFVVPIAFTAEATVEATGVDGGFGFSGTGQATYQLDGFDLVGPVQHSVAAFSGGTTFDTLSEDIVTGEGTVWQILTSASAVAGGAEPVVGASASASASAAVGDVTINVDFVLTRQLILANTPLSPALTDQGLAELSVVASPGVSLTGFAPQFGPPAPVPATDFFWRVWLMSLLALVAVSSLAHFRSA